MGVAHFFITGGRTPFGEERNWTSAKSNLRFFTSVTCSCWTRSTCRIQSSEPKGPGCSRPLKYVDYCILNEIEAGKTSGFKIRQPDGTLDTVALRHAAGALLQSGVRELVVIHFPEGGFIRTRKGEDVWQPSIKLPDKFIAGTAGAGDAFCAGVLLGLQEGWDLAQCLHAAVCVAAASLSHPTCTGGMKPLSNCFSIRKKYGYRAALDR